MAKAKEDRRTFHRVSGIVNVRYGVRDRDKEKIETLPRNIGGGGMGVCLTEKLQEGTILELEITVPDDPRRAVLGVGEIVWTKPFGIIEKGGQSVGLYETGIKFIDIDPLAVGRVYSYYSRMGQI